MNYCIELNNGTKIYNSNDFIEWISNHNVLINSNLAQLDQAILIYYSINNINTRFITAKDGNNEIWNASVIMISQTTGIYRNDKKITVNSKIIKTSGRLEFKITTYNILTGSHTGKGQSPYERELKASPWKHRMHLVIDSIHDSDIVMLNECTIHQKNDIIKNTNLVEGVFYLKRHGNYDGSGIFYNPTKFKIIDRYTDVINPDNSQVVVAIILEELHTKKKFILVSLHLKSGYAEQEKRRMQEFRIAMKKVNSRLHNIDTLPCIVGGDFNSDFNSSYAELVKNYIPSNYMLRNAAAEPKGIGESTPTYNYWHKSVFDYLLISPTINVINMTTQDSKNKSPNLKQGSDHFPVTALLEIV